MGFCSCRLDIQQGLGLLLLASPLMAVLFASLTTARKLQLKTQDRRVRLTTEVLAMIRQIKLYAYESYFGKRIGSYREKELARLRKRNRDEASLEMLMVSPTLSAADSLTLQLTSFPRL
jgi:ATP-binding cassette subfamily C (CFTR/MRP) protein 1